MEILPMVSFFTGVISILSPCILPIIPLFAAVSLKAKSKREIISFISGFAGVFLIIIFLTGFFTSLVYGYISYVRIASAAVLLIIGFLMLFDYSPDFSVKSSKKSDGIVGSFVMGLVTSISWAPCYSAYLISLIALLAGSAGGWYAVFNIMLYVVGFSLTLAVLSLIISKIDLEKLVLKTKYIPKIFAVLIIVSAVYLFWESLKVFI